MTLYIILLFILGSIFGSFSTVLIERWKHHKSGILMGRSECPKCHHTLSAKELIPIFSYIFQKGKCHACGGNIPPFYPLVEVFFGIIFSFMGYISLSFGNDPISYETLILLILGFITGVYTVYDIKYTEIPDQIMVPGIIGYIILIILCYFYTDMETLIFDRGTYVDYRTFLMDHFSAIVLIYSFFYLQIIIPGGYFLLKKKKYADFMGLLLGYLLFPITLLSGRTLYSPETNNEDTETIPTWIGGGDLRIALFVGITLGSIHTISTLFFAYILGSVIGIYILIVRKGEKNSQIPFGPFLGMGWFLSFLFYDTILSLFSI